MGVTARNTEFIGFLFILFISIVFGLVASKMATSWGINPVLIITCLISPGISLLLERGNFDALIFIMLMFATFLLFRGNEISAVLLISSTVLMKFYTLPTLLLCVIVCRTARARFISVALILLTSILVLIDFSHLSVSIFPQNWYAAFGASVAGLLLASAGIHLGAVGGYILGLALLLLTIFVLQRFLPSPPIPDLRSPDIGKRWGLDAWLVSIIGSTFVSCYIAGLNFDYRRIYLAIVGLVVLSRLPQKTSVRRFGNVILVLSLWCSYQTFGVFLHKTHSFVALELIGGVAIGLFTAYLSLEIVKLVRPTIDRRRKISNTSKS